MYIIYIYILSFYRYKKILFSLRQHFNNKTIIKAHKKKNLFFKKKNLKQVLVSKRLSIVIRKRKKLKLFKHRKLDKGKFFFKKFFFKILLKNRKFLKNFFFLNKKTRQKKITKFILNNGTSKSKEHNSCYEYCLLNVLLRSRLFFFEKDVFNFVRHGLVFLNGKSVSNWKCNTRSGDCIQLSISSIYYRYFKFSRKLLKKKLSLYKFSIWKFFRQKHFKKKKYLKPKKRKFPKFLNLFSLYKLNTPRTLEVDFCTLSVFLLKKEPSFIQSSYYLNKSFSFKLFSLYNYKKIN